ncbi:MAG: MBL fold metallo-hydrolase [Candidatus Cloacimonadota bacterium]|nr:MAG: MBL fold metallo-hydrolase [Candidatus Cloacimonadota bacterium]
MKVKFWGVSGSIASPCTSQMIRAKTEQVLLDASADDIKDESSIKKYLDSRPFHQVGTYKGSTSCVQVIPDSGDTLIFDCGTGGRALGLALMGTPLGRGQGTAHIFFTHLHWDHISGFPFFTPAYIPGNKLNIYGVTKSLIESFPKQMQYPFFPVLFEQLGAEINFKELQEKEVVKIGDITIGNERLYHPQVSHAYSVVENGKKIVYMTDSEFNFENLDLIQKAIEFCKDADVFIFDCQFTFADTISKMDWGHSSVFTGIDIATAAGAKTLVLFHHEPSYDDTKIGKIIEEGIIYKNKVGNKDLNIVGGYEGLELEF